MLLKIFFKTKEKKEKAFIPNANLIFNETRNLYYTEAENLFLNYACYLLLEGSKKSIDYNKPIFDQPLPQSRFDENYDDIDTSWRVNNTMTPLFVNTQTSKPKVKGKKR